MISFRPFLVSPENGLLPVGESMQVTIEFQPTINGEIKDELAIIYDTGLFCRNRQTK
jgi:hydrocephalus-inducing protein